MPNPYAAKCAIAGGVWCEAEKKYLEVLEEMLIPADDGTLERYEAVVALAAKLGVDNEWSKKAADAVRRLTPKKRSAPPSDSGSKR